MNSAEGITRIEEPFDTNPIQHGIRVSKAWIEDDELQTHTTRDAEGDPKGQVSNRFRMRLHLQESECCRQVRLAAVQPTPSAILMKGIRLVTEDEKDAAVVQAETRTVTYAISSPP